MRAFACTRDDRGKRERNELRFAKPSFTARPVRLDLSHFYHPGLATTGESRIGCGGTNEGDGGEEGGSEGQERQSGSCRVPLTPLHAALRVSLRVSPFLRRTNQPAALSLQLFAEFNHLATRSDARRGLVGFSRNPRLSRLPKAVPNVIAAVLLVPCRHHPTSAHQLHKRVLPSQPEIHPSQPLARPVVHRHRPRPTRKTLR